MAIAERIRKLSPVRDVRFHPPLSKYQAACLCQRLADCEASVREAFVGASEALRQTRGAPAVVRLCLALDATLRQLQQEKQLAGSGLLGHSQEFQQ